MPITFLLQLKVPEGLEKSIYLNATKLTLSLSGKILTQFKVLDYQMYTNADDSRFHVRILLQRLYLYHLTTTYLPTLTLLILVEATLFFKDPLLQYAIGLCLTIMLVMYTMFQGVNYTMPQTAYLKFIDWWLIFCLLMPFIVFLVEIFWELYRYHQEKNLAKNTATQNKWLNGEKKTVAIKIPLKGQVRLAIVFFTIVCIIGYGMTAISYYNSN